MLEKMARKLINSYVNWLYADIFQQIEYSFPHELPQNAVKILIFNHDELRGRYTNSPIDALCIDRVLIREGLSPGVWLAINKNLIFTRRFPKFIKTLLAPGLNALQRLFVKSCANVLFIPDSGFFGSEMENMAMEALENKQTLCVSLWGTRSRQQEPRHGTAYMVMNAIRKLGAENVVVIPVGTRWKDKARNQVQLSFGEAVRVDLDGTIPVQQPDIDLLSRKFAEKINALCDDLV